MRASSLETVRVCWEHLLGVPGDSLIVVRLGDTAIVRSPVTQGRTGFVRAYAHLAYTDVVPDIAGASRLDATDPRLERFAASMAAEEWDESGLARGAGLAAQFGVVAGYELAAVAGYEVWDGCVAHVCVAATTDERGRGYAKAAAAAATAHAVEAGFVAQWRSSVTNERSAGLGASLGFERVGEQLVVRFD